MKKLFLGFCLLLGALLPAHAALTPPDQLVRTVTDDVLEIVRQDQDIQRGNADRAIALVEEKVLPHFNFRRMTMLAVGRDWRQATPEQQARLVDSFRTLLVRTYSNALTQYRDQTIDFRPLRAAPSDTTVQVRTEVRQSGAQPIAIDYVLERTDAGWKVFDVIVAGVSLVTNYRGTFSQEIRSSGIDGLIDALERRNGELAGSAAR
ncbi:ABC transporter substrate-binding protein [Thauera sp. CAU 1555]|uniref:ABC transporter substrate-binding protein n=1 Tax=Thauera sedimentorum TaxID=2767595 RepID=A0ABR9BEU4_9RHOO|nr:ABC transporter substrate-binding protein [Thauera sedimentorum]MBC9073565.1 ABC transporter substrate-binding protein [Thauera sedimentorum]MBD8504484.1 ABC transporter substrate-binding protein [Thauera sedimentorum]